MFMQTGFAMVETGLTQAKNVAHTFAMNFMIYPLGMLGFYVCGIRHHVWRAGLDPDYGWLLRPEP
jgi:ammonia channel protein AmtB